MSIHKSDIYQNSTAAASKLSIEDISSLKPTVYLTKGIFSYNFILTNVKPEGA